MSLDTKRPGARAKDSAVDIGTVPPRKLTMTSPSQPSRPHPCPWGHTPPPSQTPPLSIVLQEHYANSSYPSTWQFLFFRAHKHSHINARTEKTQKRLIGRGRRGVERLQGARKRGSRYQWKSSPAVTCSSTPAGTQIHTCMGHTSYSAGRARSVRDTSLGRSDLMRRRGKRKPAQWRDEFRKESEKKDQSNEPDGLYKIYSLFMITRINNVQYAFDCHVWPYFVSETNIRN